MDRPRVWPWRLSLVLAAVVFAATLWSFYDVWERMRMAELLIPGSDPRIDWSRAGLNVLIGIVIPAVWTMMAWGKAFPRRPRTDD